MSVSNTALTTALPAKINVKPSNIRDISSSILAQNGSIIPVQGRLVGPDNAPAIVVMGGISAGKEVSDQGDIKGWWRDQIGPDQAINTDHTRILSFDFLGDEITPFPTTHDQARAILALADKARIDQFSIIGSSYGGMIALALAELAPTRVTKALVISAAHKASAMAQAWRSIQRDTVELALQYGEGKAGLDLARRLAMTTYRTPEEIEQRFGAPEPNSRDVLGVASYLSARGKAFTNQVSPQRFLALSRSMDNHFVDVSQIACPVTYLAVGEDRLVPVDQIAEAAGLTPDGRLKLIKSRYGHDAFLTETTQIGDALTEFTGG